MLKIEQIKNRTILLDSNIPIYYASDGFKERSGNPLRVLMSNGNKLAIIPLSGVEILQADNRADVQKKYLKFLDYVPNVQMQLGYFQNAAELAEEYRRVCNKKKIPTVDLVIGGTVAAHSFVEDNLLLFTGDRDDFCEPLWRTVSHLAVTDKTTTNIQVNLYLLELNTEMISEKNHPKNSKGKQSWL